MVNSLMNLSNSKAAQLQTDVSIQSQCLPDCGFDREQVEIGQVHFGPGAFHRGHQAVYTNQLLLKGYKNLGISEVSINSPKVRDCLKQQDNLYTLAVRDRDVSFHVIGAVKEVLVAPEDPDRVLKRLANDKTKVVTLTVTEKGYCLDSKGELDWQHPGIVHDVKFPNVPKTVIGFLTRGLWLRYQAGKVPFVVVSCDNVSDNGKLLGKAVAEFALRQNVEFGLWVQRHVHFPCTMVDSITPATTDETRQQVLDNTGFDDAWPVQRESFSQWVIEDIAGAQLPPWHEVGAIKTSNVRGYELTKLRVLNGLHSSLAFIGSNVGLSTVRQAVTEPGVLAFVQSLLEQEIIPSLPEVDGLDAEEYGDVILQRFNNPAIEHLLSQIACDSSQKIPYRFIKVIEENFAAGRRCDKLCFVLASWVFFVIEQVKNQNTLSDPLADELAARAAKAQGNVLDIDLFFGPEAILESSIWQQSQINLQIKQGYQFWLKRNELNWGAPFVFEESNL